jgi:HSP20 family protein
MAFDKFGRPENLEEWSRNIGSIMDEMLSRSFVGFCDGDATWQPATNVYETRDAYYICVDLAGVEQQQIDVQAVNRRRITISGARSQPRPPQTAREFSMHAMEISEGAFRREIELPEPVEPDRVEASYSKGFLWITLPRTKSA